jgi:hypothetical protein
MVGGFGDEDQVSPPQIRRAPATAGAAPQVYERLNLLPDGLRKAPPTLDDTDSMMEMTMASHPFAGLWVTEDGYIRHQLLPNGRYVEARGHREKAYQGRYEVTGNHIDYKDDTGFTADGEFRRDVLYHAGMVLMGG